MSPAASQGRIPIAAERLALLWAGLLIGVSFLATPAKFLAPSLPLPTALDVGRQTFMVMSWFELALGIGLAFLGLAATTAARHWRIACVVPGILAVAQAVWLLPLLDARVSQILAGATPPPSQLHRLYIVMEVVKLAVLLTIGFRARRLAATS